MHYLYTLLVLLFAQAVSAIFGSVNGNRCLEPKKNGCCETWKGASLGQIVECPNKPRLHLYCQVAKGTNNICLPWTRQECVDSQFTCRGLVGHNGKWTICGECWQKVQLSESFYKGTVDRLTAICAQKGGKLKSDPDGIHSACFNACLLVSGKLNCPESP